MADVKVNIIAEDSFSGVLGNFGSIITGIESALRMAGDAFRFFTDIGSDFVKSAMESEDAIANINATLESTQHAAGMSAEELIKMADGFQAVTRFSDEAILNGEAMLLTFTMIGEDVFPAATEAMLNLAAKMGNDLPGAAIQLGKALNDPITGVTALRRVGVMLTDQQEEQIKKFMELGDIESAQLVILRELEVEFGGLAIAMGQTFGGQLEILKNKLDTVKEALGGAIIPTLSQLMDVTKPLVNTISEWLTTDGVALLREWGDQLVRLVEPMSLIAQVFFMRMDAGADPITALVETLKGANFPEFQSFIDSVLAFLQTGQSEGWGTAIGGLIEGALAAIDIPGKVAGIVSLILTTLEGKSEQIGKVLGPLIQGALEIALAGIAIATDIFMPLAQTIVDSIALAFRNVNIGEEIMRNIIGDVYYEQSFQDVVDVIGKMIVDAWKNFWSGNSQVRELGRSITDGIELGLNIMSFGLYGRVQAMAQSIIDLFKRIFGIASPSTVFAEIGANIMQGLMAGIASMVTVLLSYITNVVKILMTPFEPLLDMLGVSNDSIGTGLSGGLLGGGTGGTLTTGTQNYYNYYYGPVYFQGTGQTNGGVDCQSPNPALNALGSQLPAMGVR